MWDVIIVGGGAAGCSAAIYSGRFGLRTLLLDRGSGDGQLVQAAKIENYPGIRSIRGSELFETLRQQAQQCGATVQAAEVRAVRLDRPIKQVETAAEIFEARAVIFATGAHPRRLGLAEEDSFLGRGVCYCATCDAPLYRGKTVGVVGGGNSAVAEALHLSRICKEVHLLFRRSELRAGQAERDLLQAQQNVRFHASTQPQALLGDGRLRGVLLSDGSTLPLDGLFVAIGRQPESALLRSVLSCDASGGIITDGEMRTALSGVFAAGDVRQKAVRQVITAASDGVVAACSAEKYMKSVSQSD